MTFRVRSASLAVGTAALTLSIGLLAGLPVSGFAQEASTAAGQTLIPQVSIADADLRSAITMLKAQTGIDIVLEQPGDTAYGLVNVTLTNRSLDFVLRRIAGSAGADVRVEDGVYVVGPKGAVKQPVKTNPEPLPQRVEPPVKRQVHYEKIRLQQSRASELKSILCGWYDEMKANFWEEGMRQLGALEGDPNSIRKLDGPKNPSLLFPNGVGGSQIVPPVVPTDRAPAIVPNGRNGQNGQEEGQRGGLGGGGLGGGGLGGGGLGGGGLGGGGLGGGGLGGGQGGTAANLLPDGIQSVTAYDVDNTLIVRYDTDDALRELKEIVRLLDIAPKQLMIKAEFIQVQQDDIRNFGIDFQVQRGALTATTGQSATGEVQVNFATGNLVAALRASLVEGRGRIVNSPTATTTNNVPVSLQIGTNVPVITTSVAFGNNGQGITVPNIQVIQVSSGLQCLPRINGDNTISMFVVPFVQDILSEVANPAGGTIPITTFQSVPVTRRIGNGETMVIGGLIKKNDRTSVKKVPLFGDLPLIGNLFQTRGTTISDSELLVFITPTILPDPVGQGAPASIGTSSPVRP